MRENARCSPAIMGTRSLVIVIYCEGCCCELVAAMDAADAIN